MSRRSSSVATEARRDATVWKLLFNGNYGDIVAKLGQELFEDAVKIEKAHELLENLPQQMQTHAGGQLVQDTLARFSEFTQTLSPDQRLLRDICIDMNFPGRTCRPSWANGAHVVVTPSIASEIQDAFEEEELRKGHIIVSDSFRDVVHRMLSAQTPAEFMRNCGAMQPKLRQEEKITLATFSPSDAASARGDVSLAEKLFDPISYDLQRDGTFLEVSRVKVGYDPSIATRQTHTTGSRPRSQRAAKRSYGPMRKNFKLCKLAQPDTYGARLQALPHFCSEVVVSTPEDSFQDGVNRQPMCQHTAAAFNNDEGGHHGQSHSQHEPGPVADQGFVYESGQGLAFIDAQSESSMHTCETSLSFAAESQEELLNRIVSLVKEPGYSPSIDVKYQEAMKAFQDEMQAFQQAQVRLAETGTFDSALAEVPEKPTMFSICCQHVESCMRKLAHDLVPSLLGAELLESRLASLSRSANVSLEHAKLGQDRLSKIIRTCCSKQVLLQILQPESERSSTLQLLAADLEGALLRLFKKTNRQKRVNLKTFMSEEEHPEGLHDVADMLRKMMIEAFEEAVSQIDVVDLAESSLQKTHGEKESKSIKKSADSVGYHFTDPALETPDHATHIIEREQMRRAGGVKGNTPGQLHGNPQVRHGRVTGIRLNENESSRLHHF